MRKILVLAVRSEDGLDDATWELLEAGRSLAGGGEVHAALLGSDAEPLVAELGRGFDVVHVFAQEQLAIPDGDAWAVALAVLIRRESPALTLMAHDNVAIDVAPRLSVQAGVPLLSDCISLEASGDRVAAVRALYGGKVHGRFSAARAEHGVLATIRGGAFPAAERSDGPAAEVRRVAVHPEDAPRRRFVSTVEPEAGEVDISQAEVLVAVGRGIEEMENLELVRALADALGGEVACSRPVVDKGWLPKSRQVGTSGATVKPRLYVAVGVSGSFQHVGGIKGSPYIVAINKDPKAPIFGVADVGVVGDLFEVVPALERQVREARGRA